MKKKENKEEVVVEKPKQEDIVPAPIAVNKPDPNGKPYCEVVEEERKSILVQSKKSSRLSTISIVVVLVLAIPSIFFLSNYQVVSFILMGLAVVTLIVFSIIIRRVAKPDVKGYVVKASEAINEFVFDDNRFSDVKYDPNDKVLLEDIAGDGVYQGLVRVASRNVVEGLFDGRSFKVCEAAFFKQPQKRRDVPAFIGKYFVTTNDLHFEGRIVLVSKGEADTDIPDALDDLLQLENEDKFFAYGPDENALKNLNNKFIKAVKDIEVKGHLMNLTFIIWAGRTIAYASYDDATITLPFYEKYQEETAVQYKNDLTKILEAAQLLKEFNY